MIESVSGDTRAGVALQHATAVTRLTKSETDVPILTVASPVRRLHASLLYRGHLGWEVDESNVKTIFRPTQFTPNVKR